MYARNSLFGLPRSFLLLATFTLFGVWLTCLAADEQRNAGKQAVTVRRLGEVEKQKSSWGWIAWLMNAKVHPDAAMTFGVVELKPHQSNPLHLHPDSEELLYVVSGSCEHRVGDRVDVLKAGDIIRIPPGRPHMARTLDQPVRVVVVYNTGTRKFVPIEQEAKKR